MAGRWNTHRGDDWWYAGGATAADGAYNPAASMFEITRVQGGEVQPAALHELIYQSSEQFAGSNVFVVLDGSTRPALTALAAASLVAWEEFKQPYSLWARILKVVPPNNSSKPTPLRGAA